MSETKKYQEFWISTGFHIPEVWYDKGFLNPDAEPHFHVIEYSAYSQALEKIKTLTAQNDVMREALEVYTPKRKILCNHDDPSWCTSLCYDYGFAARQALAKVADTKNK